MFNPSGLDSEANYAGDRPDPCWLCLMTHNRDSELLTESNWDTALQQLGGEGDDVQIFRFGHWACGWWEALTVKAGTQSETVAQEIADALADYPVLDEEDFSEREQSEADRAWRDWYSPQERIDYIRKHRSQFEFHDMRDLLSCVRGQYFAGYASELVS